MSYLSEHGLAVASSETKWGDSSSASQLPRRHYAAFVFLPDTAFASSLAPTIHASITTLEQRHAVPIRYLHGDTFWSQDPHLALSPSQRLATLLPNDLSFFFTTICPGVIVLLYMLTSSSQAGRAWNQGLFAICKSGLQRYIVQAIYNGSSFFL